MTGLTGNGGGQSCRGQKLHSIVTLAAMCALFTGGREEEGRMLVLLNPIYIEQYSIKACEICQDITKMLHVLQKFLKINV